MNYSTVLGWLFASGAVFAQPEVSTWIVNPLIETGYGGYETNVQTVDYSANNVYIACTCIPGYDIGPWAGNPNTPANQNFVFKITRNPAVNNGTKIATPLGHIGLWSNGVSIFNALDGFSYNSDNVWHQDAVVNEGSSFDNCLGHPAGNGEYHNHLNPHCLYDDDNSSVHSPIIGYAFDGFPVYGAYGYANADGTGGIARMTSSYQLRNITVRTTLPNGSAASSAGPDVSASYPLGFYVEDYEYIQGLGTLDRYNGRECITPEYPGGTYAYFVTIDANGEGVYPYVIGPEYYGLVQPGNTGPASGHNTPSESVTNYATADVVEREPIRLNIFPNPVADRLYISLSPGYSVSDAIVTTTAGTVVRSVMNTAGGIDVSDIASGTYLLAVNVGGVYYNAAFVK